MINEEILVAVTLADSSVTIRRIFTKSRGSILPDGAVWEDQASGVWRRTLTPAVIRDEVLRAHSIGSPPVAWRVVSETELPAGWDKPDRGLYRNALADKGDRCEHDMPKARECHRRILREQRLHVMADLDGQFMRALGQGKKAEQDAVEAERQKWRDAPADPRIEAAQSIEELKQVKVV